MRYSFYGFGCPLLITILIYLIDTLKLFSKNYLPSIGVEKCWIGSGDWIQAIYVHIPISALVIVNLMLFTMTVRTVWKAQNINRKVIIPRYAFRRIYNLVIIVKISHFRISIYFRLFIIMGIMWGLDIIHLCFNKNESNSLIFVIDLFNGSQGVLIFLVCVVNRTTRRIILGRLVF